MSSSVEVYKKEP